MSSEKNQSLFNLFPLALFRDKIELADHEREILVNEILSQEKNSKISQDIIMEAMKCVKDMRNSLIPSAKKQDNYHS